jgi:hypothetical protein
LPNIGLEGRRFVEQLVAGQFEGATRRLDATMRKTLPAGKLAALWHGLEQEFGGFARISNTRTENIAGYRVAFVTCDFEREVIDAKVVLSAEGEITGLFFLPMRETVKWSPPGYARRAAFSERDVTIGKPPWELPGTLSTAIQKSVYSPPRTGRCWQGAAPKEYSWYLEERQRSQRWPEPADCAPISGELY